MAGFNQMPGGSSATGSPAQNFINQWSASGQPTGGGNYAYQMSKAIHPFDPSVMPDTNSPQDMRHYFTQQNTAGMTLEQAMMNRMTPEQRAAIQSARINKGLGQQTNAYNGNAYVAAGSPLAGNGGGYYMGGGNPYGGGVGSGAGYNPNTNFSGSPNGGANSGGYNPNMNAPAGNAPVGNAAYGNSNPVWNPGQVQWGNSGQSGNPAQGTSGGYQTSGSAPGVY